MGDRNAFFYGKFLQGSIKAPVLLADTPAVPGTLVLTKRILPDWKSY